MLKNLKLFLSYIRDKEVPTYRKILIGVALLYLFLPVDIVPDFILGAGLIDDIAVIAFVWNAIKSEIREYGDRLERMKFNEAKVIDINEKKKKN